MVKRALLAAQKGDGEKLIAGLRTVRVGQRQHTVAVASTASLAGNGKTGQKRLREDEPAATAAATATATAMAAAAATATQPAAKKPRKQKQVVPVEKVENETTTEEQASTPLQPQHSFRVKNSLVESIYGSEEAAKKRRIMEHKSLDKVTSVREAFEVCFFKAERSEADAERTKLQLEQALANLAEMRKSKAKINELVRIEEQVRQLRAKITTARATHQTPIDVLVNVAKFSMANCVKEKDSVNATEKQENDGETEKGATEPKGARKAVGSIASLCLSTTIKPLLQSYVNSIKHTDAKLTTRLPPLQFNTSSAFASEMAQQICEWDSVHPLHWTLVKQKKPDEKEQDDEEEEEEEDDVFDDTACNQWLAQHSSVDERLIDALETKEHPSSHTWEQLADERTVMQSTVAERVADRLVSLFFKTQTVEQHGATEIQQQQQQKQAKDPRADNEKKAVSVVRIGHLEKSAAIGGKSRNRVRNKMKPARNTENVSIMNFLRVKMHEMSDKHVEAAKFIDFMQNFERQHCDGQQGSGDSIFSTFANKQNQLAAPDKRGVKRKRDDVGDCSNAAESLPLPNYTSPQCRFCKAPVHVSSRTGMETCTSPSCAATVYMATGFDVVHLEQQIHNTYQYLLAVHMKSTLRRVQGKESAMVPKRVKDAVRNRLIMERADLKRLTAKKVKLVLKKLDLSAWYNHRHKICASITGRKPYQFTAEEEDVILAVFERLIEPYNLYRPKTDENFPYYRYALHKILQLLGYPDEVLRDFPILKARKNHRRKEQIWEKMMLYRGWPYHKS